MDFPQKKISNAALGENCFVLPEIDKAKHRTGKKSNARWRWASFPFVLVDKQDKSDSHTEDKRKKEWKAAKLSLGFVFTLSLGEIRES